MALSLLKSLKPVAGRALQIALNRALALDPDSPLLWIADTGNGCIRSLRLGGGVVTRLELRKLAGPAGVAAFGGKLWISETDAHAVLCLDLASNTLTQVPIDE